MPRKSRNEIITNYSHIIVQGIEKKYIFQEEYFKELYLKLLRKNLEELNILILAYCIMDNHIHILLYSEDKNEIMKYMQRVNTGFAIKFNIKNKRVGYVFRDRYYLQPITNEKQLFNCLVYIHRNPIKANIISKYEDYKFSSYNEFYRNKVIITEKSLELIFGTSKNYLEIFEKIHKDRYIEDITDVTEFKDENIIIKDFCIDNCKSLDQIKMDKELLKILLIKLKNESGVSIRNLEKIFEIGRETIRKMLK